jgi:hypothetical protein
MTDADKIVAAIIAATEPGGTGAKLQAYYQLLDDIARREQEREQESAAKEASAAKARNAALSAAAATVSRDFREI